ncbi:MAG: M28 family peptidase, partial [Gemmataceae bacterium]
SDYGPFRDRSVPFLFFSTGHHADYHRPSDLPEKIDYDKLKRNSDWIVSLVDRLANDDAAPRWQPIDEPDIDEVRTVHLLLSRVLDRPGALPLTETQRHQVDLVRKRLKQILDNGKFSTVERTAMIWSARLLMFTVFQ